MKHKHELEARESSGGSPSTEFSKLVFMHQYKTNKILWRNIICCLVGLIGAALLVLRHKL